MGMSRRRRRASRRQNYAAAAISAKPCCDGENEMLSCEDSEVGGVEIFTEL